MENQIVNGRGLWRYELTNMAIDGEENMRYTTYGVRALDSDGTARAAYANVGTDRQRVEALVERCNKGGLHLLHLEDVVLDFIE